MARVARALRLELVMKRDDVKIGSPCTVDWKNMTPAEGGRFCGDCKKVVKNLSQMTEREAKKVLRTANDGQLCVRFVYDTQGKIFFGADAPKPDVPVSALFSRVKRLAAGAAFAAASQACGGETDDAHPSTVVGELAYVAADAGSDAATDPPDTNEMMGAPAFAEDSDDAGVPDDDAAVDGGAAPTK